jgi:TDG/mug DNA glycosylase family protein
MKSLMKSLMKAARKKPQITAALETPPATNRVHSFPPLAAPDATRLILGSMPGVASLAAQQYYAHPRNAFWHVVEAALGLPAALPYEQRCEQLTRRGIAVWDVLKTCTRSGSLDSAIDTDSIITNDFAGFFKKHPHIELICFNGTKAEAIWRRHVARTLPESIAVLPTLRLPSTSPAHASLSLTQKVAGWQNVLNPTHQSKRKP